MNTSLYAIGIVVHALATAVAFFQVRRASLRLPWFLIASSAFLIVIRRLMTLRTSVVHGQPIAEGEYATLLVSALFLAGVLLMSRVFRQTLTAHDELVRVRLLLDRTEQLAQIGGWEWNPITQTMTWTDETYRIHGFSPGDIAARSPEHIARSIACYAEEDRPRIRAAFRRCVETGEPYELTCRLTTLDGRHIWIDTLGRAEMSDGRVVRVFGHIIDVTARVDAEHARQQTIEDLRHALDHVRTLRGILPICASCKKIRDDDGYWQQVESYIRDHSQAEFTHGLCPECAERLYPETTTLRSRA